MAPWGKLAPPLPWRHGAPPAVERARDLDAAVYLTDLVDITRESDVRQGIGTFRKAWVKRNADPVPAHLTQLTAQYAGFFTGGLAGETMRPSVSVGQWVAFVPVGTRLQLDERLVVRDTGERFDVIATNHAATLRGMEVARVVHQGVDDQGRSTGADQQ
jgi:hypothetical protein